MYSNIQLSLLITFLSRAITIIYTSNILNCQFLFLSLEISLGPAKSLDSEVLNSLGTERSL